MALGPFRTPPRIRAPTRSSCCRADTTDARVALFGPITRSTFFVIGGNDRSIRHRQDGRHVDQHDVRDALQILEDLRHGRGS